MVLVHVEGTPDGVWDESRGTFSVDPDGTLSVYSYGTARAATKSYGRHAWRYARTNAKGSTNYIGVFNPLVQHQGHPAPSELVAS
jgi:hypothetical protein